MKVASERRARLTQYAAWMFRDYAANQGPSTGVVVTLIGFLTVLPVINAPGAGIRLGDVPADTAARMLHAIVTPLTFLGTFFATNGIIANDRKLGYYRFLFAKPVNPPLYYAATFAVYGVGLLLLTMLLMGVWWFAVRPMFPVELLGIVVVMYIAYGGIGFLLSAAWRFDWISLVSVIVVANVAWNVWGNSTGMAHTILYLLPPVHRANDVYGIVARAPFQPLPWGSILWLGGYGLACFLLGMLVVRQRPLGTS